MEDRPGLAEWSTGIPLKPGDVVLAPYKKRTWLDRAVWWLFRYEIKRKTEMRHFVVGETYTSTGKFSAFQDT